MPNYKDYYQILGVGRDATQEDIKQAYRRLAREHHPDMAKDRDKEAAEKRFKEINEAYQVLGDPQKRKMYDQFGQVGAEFGAGPQGFSGFQQGPFTYTYTTSGEQPFGFGFENFDPFDVFENFFGFRGFGGRGSRRGKNLYYEMTIDFGEAIFGLEKEINVESGRVVIKIPQGVRDGTELRFAGKGMPRPDGGTAGDLYITVRVNTPKEFEMVGDTLVYKAEIDFVRAVLGGVIDIPVVDIHQLGGVGRTQLRIPPGTQSGSQFLIRGKGMPRLKGRGQGDILVQVLVRIPKKVSRRQRDLLEEYGNL